MRKILLVIACLIQSIAFAQNVIFNSGFEQHTDCPLSLGMGGPTNIICPGWTPASGGSPDYYNVCNGNTVTGVPHNIFGRMIPENGNAYVGEYTYVPSQPGSCNEYLMTSFPALIPGQKYRLSMYVVLGKMCNFATYAPDAFFSTYGSPDSLTYSALPVSPQISFASLGFITDTSSWVHLSASFIADSAYTFMILGSFLDSAHAVFEQVSLPPEPGAGTEVGAYYYIDSVTLVPYDGTAVATASKNMTRGQVIPNPVTGNGIIQFDNPFNEKYTLYIYNETGMLVEQCDDITTGNVTINPQKISSGLYYYRLTSLTGAPANGSFVMR